MSSLVKNARDDFMASGDNLSGQRQSVELASKSYLLHSNPLTRTGPGRARPVVIVDDRALSRDSLVHLLRKEMRRVVVVSLGSTEAFLAHASESRVAPSMIVFNINARSPLDPVVRSDVIRFQQAASDVPLVLLVDAASADAVTAALTLGVRGVIPTSIPPKVIARALMLVAVGGTFVPSEAFLEGRPAAADGAEASPAPRQTARFGAMTPRELEVLALLQQGKPNKVIALDLDMKESTVKVHVRHIMRKLGATNRTQAVLRSQSLFGKSNNGQSDR
ncbi:MAG: DNA-binding response regulator [Rhodospirillales bacterium]|nr:MAG: DNA-binding response regulator [Rhodospirillales bacterium]